MSPFVTEFKPSFIMFDCCIEPPPMTQVRSGGQIIVHQRGILLKNTLSNVEREMFVAEFHDYNFIMLIWLTE